MIASTVKRTTSSSPTLEIPKLTIRISGDCAPMTRRPLSLSLSHSPVFMNGLCSNATAPGRTRAAERRVSPSSSSSSSSGCALYLFPSLSLPVSFFPLSHARTHTRTLFFSLALVARSLGPEGDPSPRRPRSARRVRTAPVQSVKRAERHTPTNLYTLLWTAGRSDVACLLLRSPWLRHHWRRHDQERIRRPLRHGWLFRRDLNSIHSPQIGLRSFRPNPRLADNARGPFDDGKLTSMTSACHNAAFRRHLWRAQPELRAHQIQWRN